MGKDEVDKNQQYDQFVEKYIWLVRPCKDYKEELKECTALKGRFHQYFLYGELVDCSTWSQDAKNCGKCLKEKNNEACKVIIKNETERRLKRLNGAKQNDVWKKRDKPPENWNPPLPKYFLDRNADSLFKEKRDEFNEYVAMKQPNQLRSCTIL